MLITSKSPPWRAFKDAGSTPAISTKH